MTETDAGTTQDNPEMDLITGRIKFTCCGKSFHLKNGSVGFTYCPFCGDSL